MADIPKQSGGSFSDLVGRLKRQEPISLRPAPVAGAAAAPVAAAATGPVPSVGGGVSGGGGGGGDMYGSLMDLYNRLGSYAPVNPDDVYRGLSERVANFAPQYQEMRNQQAAAYAAPAEVLADYQNQFGTEAGVGTSALSRLNKALQTIGQRYSTADIMGDIIGQQRGRLEQLSQSAVNQNALEQQALESQYNRALQLYQMQQQKAAQAAQDAWQRQFMEQMYGNTGAGAVEDPYAGLEVETEDTPMAKPGVIDWIGDRFSGWGAGISDAFSPTSNLNVWERMLAPAAGAASIPIGPAYVGPGADPGSSYVPRKKPSDW